MTVVDIAEGVTDSDLERFLDGNFGERYRKIKRAHQMKRVYKTSPIRRDRRRRTRRELGIIRQALYETLAADNPATVRQVFYRLVSAGVIQKTEVEYKGTICRLLAEMRRQNEIPFNWLGDNTRWMRKPRTYSSAEQALQRTADFYRRAIWDDQLVYVEVWLEKDALAGVLYDVTEKWDVPLMVTRGYPSLSFLYEAAAQIREIDKPTYVYYLGDHDPSGVNIPQCVERDLRRFAPDAEIYFERIAVTPQQIQAYNLPTRPTKKSDSRAKTFNGESVEVDAIPPTTLKALVEKTIWSHINETTLRVLEAAEESERAILLKIAGRYTAELSQ